LFIQNTIALWNKNVGYVTKSTKENEKYVFIVGFGEKIKKNALDFCVFLRIYIDILRFVFL